MDTIKFHYVDVDSCPICGELILHDGNMLVDCPSCGLVYNTRYFEVLMYRLHIYGRKEWKKYEQKLKEQGRDETERKLRRKALVEDLTTDGVLGVLLILVFPFAIIAYILGYRDLD